MKTYYVFKVLLSDNTSYMHGVIADDYNTAWHMAAKSANCKYGNKVYAVIFKRSVELGGKNERN